MEKFVILEKLFYFPGKEKEGINNFPKAVRTNGLSNLNMLNKTRGKFCFDCGFECLRGGSCGFWLWVCFFF